MSEACNSGSKKWKSLNTYDHPEDGWNPIGSSWARWQVQSRYYAQGRPIWSCEQLYRKHLACWCFKTDLESSPKDLCTDLQAKAHLWARKQSHTHYLWKFQLLSSNSWWRGLLAHDGCSTENQILWLQSWTCKTRTMDAWRSLVSGDIHFPEIGIFWHWVVLENLWRLLEAQPK